MWAALVVGLPLATLPARARAADAPSPPTTGALASAEQLAAQAYELHAAGKYAEAIAMYMKAYEASNAAVTLLNVATIYDRKLHEGALAAEFYRRYVTSPDAEPELVEKATARLTALKAEEAAASKPEASSPAGAAPEPSVAPEAPAPRAAATPDAAPSRGGGVRTAGAVVLGAGVAAVGASLVLGLVAENKNNEANMVCNGAVCSTRDGVNLAHDAGTFATASTITFVSGLVLAGGGLVMVLAGGPSRASSAMALAPALGPTGGGLTLRGDF